MTAADGLYIDRMIRTRDLWPPVWTRCRCGVLAVVDGQDG